MGVRVVGVVEDAGLRVVVDGSGWSKELLIPDEDVARSGDVDAYMKALYDLFRVIPGTELSVERGLGSAFITISMPLQWVVNVDARVSKIEDYVKIDLDVGGYWSIVLTGVSMPRRMICLERDYEQKCLNLYITGVSYRLGEGKLAITASALPNAPPFKAVLIARDGETRVFYVTNTVENYVVITRRESNKHQVILVSNNDWMLMGVGTTLQGALDNAIKRWEKEFGEVPPSYMANPLIEVKNLIMQGN